MKKGPIIASLLILAVTLGLSNVSWAVNRPNTPECADVNGSFDSDACLTQYIEPLKIETERLWNRLLKLQGKSAQESPWTFKVDSPACDPDSQHYDKKFCLVQTPGKLAVEKYRLREEINKFEVGRKIKRSKIKLAAATAAIDKLIAKNEELAKKLEEGKRENDALLKQNETRVKDAQTSKDKLAKMSEDRIWLGVLFFVLVVLCIFLIADVINLRYAIASLKSRINNLEVRLLAPGEKTGSG